MLSNSYTTGCPPVLGDNPRALASGSSHVQADEPWYKYLQQPSPVQRLLSMKYFVLKFAISSKAGIVCYYEFQLVWAQSPPTSVRS